MAIHLARDCAVTALGEEDPEKVWMTPAILGHAGHAVTQRHYNHARRREAFRRFRDLIQEQRARQQRRRRGGKE